MRRAHLQGMRLRPLAVLLALAVVAAGAAARADEPIRTGAPGPPPAAEPPAPLAQKDSPEAIGAWARGVLAGAPAAAETAAERPARACPPSDGKPHGEVWAGVGTGGYRELGGVVTQPVGDCGQVTIGVSRAEGRWR
jgi:hypothetical protein